MSDSLLDIRNLRVGFSKGRSYTEVVKGIDLNLGEGEIVGLVGESGSGKSVSMMSITGLIPDADVRSEGIFFNADGLQTDLGKLDQKSMRRIRGARIAYVFQEPMTALNPLMRCGKQVAEAIHDEDTDKRSRVLELLREVELNDPERSS